MTEIDDATRAQLEAASPDRSTWLEANAGSGKTRVLTDRVARLLVDEVPPQHILCLTYTKAAASEMQNRLFKRLGSWAMLPDAELVEELRSLGAHSSLEPAALARSRTLFARAIETPGGLKIQTIHSFCASLLRRFPLEAGVSPQFTEMEDRAAEMMRAEIVDDMSEGADAGKVRRVAALIADADFNRLTGEIVRHRPGFVTPIGWVDTLALFGLPPGFDEPTLMASVFQGGEAELINKILPHLRAKGGNDEKAARRLTALGTPGLEDLAELEAVFLTGPSARQPFTAKIGSFPTKATQQVIAADMPELESLMKRVEAARQPRLALSAAQKTQRLHDFAHAFLMQYEARKIRAGALDFDDLIQRARALLSDPKVAAWVLYRIDGGIDHILVDEAQDTSPAQWDVIARLAAEFTSGEGAQSDRLRTIFVVGDKKQSIYSFQGADPREFDRMQTDFAEKFAALGQQLYCRELKHSFRSSSAVLRVVDLALGEQEKAGFSGTGGHIPFWQDLPGRVDLWPVIPVAETDEEPPWDDPLDRRSPAHHAVILAQRIAGQIKTMIDRGETIPDIVDGQTMRRPLRPGDFLILVQRRSALFAEIIRACKTLKLDIAGADRLKIGGELAVRDLTALLAFLATPEDDLSLASALKSPLFGWDEARLYDLAQGRGQTYLWQTMRNRRDAFPAEMAVLDDLRGQVDFLRPFDLVERTLTRHGGRKRLLARLGTEAEDGIDALLSQALAYERHAVPSLTGFLVWLETDDVEIKRQVDSASDQIRVMTVHGAKGLEAPVVILPDCGARKLEIKDNVLRMGDVPVWKPASSDTPDRIQTRLAQMRDAEMQERLRLLYVALTRAEKWLIVAAAGDLPRDGSSWYQWIEAAMDRAGVVEVQDQGQTIRRVHHGDWDELPLHRPSMSPDTAVAVPSYFSSSAPEPPRRDETLSPSDLGGEKIVHGEAARKGVDPKIYGDLVHLFLDRLAAIPASVRPALIDTLCAGRGPEAKDAAAEACAVLDAPDLSEIFAPGSRSEVEIAADLGGQRLLGFIDRLIIGADHVMAVDFKTNVLVPEREEDCPEGILRQMGAYAHALGQIYPDHRIETAIVWTTTPRLMVLSHDIVTQALHRSQYLDLEDAAT